jgi:GWxTD domain-containing protein
MHKRIFYLLVVIVFAAACSPSSKISKQNLEHIYNPEVPVSVQSKVLDDGPKMRVYLSMDMRKMPEEANLRTLKDKYLFSYKITSNYKSKDILHQEADLAFEQDYGRSKEGEFQASFSVPKFNMPAALLVLNVYEKSTGKNSFYDIPLDYTGKLSTKYGVFRYGSDFPLISNYFTNKDTVKVISLIPELNNKQLQATHYGEPFTPALPPMSVSSSARKGLNVSNQYDISPDKLMLFYEEGLYFAQVDTNSRDGITFVVTENRFPRVTKAEELIEPLIYITTRNERNSLIKAEKPKEALDKFWLELSGNKDFARRIIKAYYNKVENANDMFTSYKPGWKTDQGMVYIIFGAPDRLSRYDDREEWYYEKNANFPEINFTFVKKPTIFATDNYELVRYNDYDRIWYSTVEQWRKGILRK